MSRCKCPPGNCPAREAVEDDTIKEAACHVWKTSNPADRVELQRVMDRIKSLTWLLTDGKYRPLYKAYKRVLIVEEWGKHRVLTIPTVRDKLLMRCMYLPMAWRLDRALPDNVHGWRVGYDVETAVEAARFLKRAYKHCVVLDVEDAFARIRHDTVIASICRLTHCRSTIQNLRCILNPSGNRRNDIGIPLGLSISPLFFNAAAVQVDCVAHRKGIPFIRYADNIFVAGESPASLQKQQDFFFEAFKSIGLRVRPQSRAFLNHSELNSTRTGRRKSPPVIPLSGKTQGGLPPW